MRAGSLFSGIGGFDLGLERAGFEVAFQCDNDPFCNKVLAKHWPGVKRYDDVRNVGVGRTRDNLAGQPHVTEDSSASVEWGRGDVDLICGGFPCQDLSVAGKRAGLDGARSGLWFEFHRILSELRPTVALIENVPGLLSSNQGRDFGVILAGLEQLWPGRWGWAVLDSQHFGVAQRRRRLYVIAGPRRERIAQILSLCESGDWNTQARREAGEDIAATIRGRSSGPGVNEPGRGNGIGIQESETMYTLDGTSQHAMHQASGVRRLTPVECERLQGFPDGWTQLDDKTPDGPRYKALGNAVSVPVIEYLGRRIAAVLS